jgi:hypothetical protein
MDMVGIYQGSEMTVREWLAVVIKDRMEDSVKNHTSQALSFRIKFFTSSCMIWFGDEEKVFILKWKTTIEKDRCEVSNVQCKFLSIYFRYQPKAVACQLPPREDVRECSRSRT